jgi:choline kinase
MMHPSVADAVILAAGNGTRLAGLSDLPKPLVPVAGRAPLDYIVGALRDTGIDRVHVVTGHKCEQIRAHAFSPAPPAEIGWIHNPEYRRPNGLSLLSAEGVVRSPFLLLMGDHLFEPAILREFLAEPCPPAGGVLATDARINRIFDLEDATKVLTHAGRLCKIGKLLPSFNAVDIGMFLFSDQVFAAMQASLDAGAASLSAGVAVLAAAGAMRTWDVGDRCWIDMDTPAAWAEAERLAREGRFGAPEIRKPAQSEDGFPGCALRPRLRAPRAGSRAEEARKARARQPVATRTRGLPSSVGRTGT